MVTLKRFRNQRYYNKTQKRKNTMKELLNNNTSCLVINSKLIQSNINIMRKVSGTEIMPVIKGNAYGHGAVEIAKFLRSIGIRYILSLIHI